MELIAIDIGNSSINIGIFTDNRLISHKVDICTLTSSSGYESLLNSWIKGKSIDKKSEEVIISSVVPVHTVFIKEACKKLCGKEPLILTYNLNTGIDLQIKRPETLGTDRIAASAGACNLFGAPVAVIDFGTATTLNFIGNGNAYKGGAILPGIMLMKNALFNETAQLPDIQLSPPVSPLGKDTTESILSGIIYGTAGAVERILKETEENEGEIFKVVATGGYSELAAPFIKRIDYTDPNLVLKGLKFIFERNT